MDFEDYNIMKIPPYITSSPLTYNISDSTQINRNNKFNTLYIWTDIPDPDVIRVNDTYYMVSTTMYFAPHCPIMKSIDLVNWKSQITYVTYRRQRYQHFA